MADLFSQPAPGPVAWDDLDAAQAADTWEHLEDWVTWLVRRFRLRPRDVPPCWYLHGAVVEELTALWGSHQDAYSDDEAASAASEWLHVLADTRYRLADWIARTGCIAVEHREDPDVAWRQDGRFQSFVRADAAGRAPAHRAIAWDRPETAAS